MTQDEIVDIYEEVSNKLCNGTEWCWSGVGEPLQLFAKLVATKEREACAQIADEWSVGYPHPSTIIAASIRARGEQA